ncbi:MAG: glycosyl transferase family 2, partial [Terriglobia bacterium]
MLTAFAVLNPVERYLRFLLADDPFRGLYNLNTFDLLLLVPYFAILSALSFYGLHRYRLIYLYKKNRHRRPPQPAPPADWPQVTIQLPLYNEKYVVERLID